MRVLLIEDEPKIARALKKSLERDRYAVDVCLDGEEGLNTALAGQYDVMVIDRMLPHVDGISIVEQVRAQHITTPILLLTALGTVDDRATGLDSGADDYLVKPFALKELLARLRALLRRPPETALAVLTVGDLQLNPSTQQVTRANKAITLTKKEYALLHYMMSRAGQTLSKDTLTQHVWDFDADILPNTVEVYIKYLRKKIDRPFKKPLIQTVRGFGYKIEA